MALIDLGSGGRQESRNPTSLDGLGIASSHRIYVVSLEVLFAGNARQQSKTEKDSSEIHGHTAAANPDETLS
jgi:hypothetical protein